MIPGSRKGIPSKKFASGWETLCLYTCIITIQNFVILFLSHVVFLELHSISDQRDIELSAILRKVTWFLFENAILAL